MKTRRGDKKREIMWDSSKPSSTEIVPVVTERNATTIPPLQQTPEKACSDSDDDDFDTIHDPATTVNLMKKEKLQLMRTSFFNRCEGLVVNCADAAVVAFVDHMNAAVDEYIQSHPEDFPKADKVFIDERTNRPYTAPQQSRGCGGRDSTKRKESAAALGRKAAAKKSK